MKKHTKIPVGILGATGMVGQRFITLLENHPWFDVVCVAASSRSSGKRYEDAVEGRWKLHQSIPAYIKNMKLLTVEGDIQKIVRQVRLVFSALDMDKNQIRQIEESYAKLDVAVVSNNSSHRWTNDVPMIMPEINPDHIELIETQRKNRGWHKGLIVVKPNCSLQSYIPIIHALSVFEPVKISVTTLQAISGAGRTFDTWPEMLDNCIPYIGGEEEKTEKEPLKILGEMKKGIVKLKENLDISATCIRVAVADGHMASVFVKFNKKPTREAIVHALTHFENPLKDLHLPSAPELFIKYFPEDDRPQTHMDRDLGNGMTISCGRFREDQLFDWKFVSLSHNTIRGAAGGAILTAELLKAKKLI